MVIITLVELKGMIHWAHAQRVKHCKYQILQSVSYQIIEPKGGCNRWHGLSAAIKLGCPEKIVIASLFHSGLRSDTIFLWKKQSHVILGNERLCRFLTKKETKKFYDAKLIF